MILTGCGIIAIEIASNKDISCILGWQASHDFGTAHRLVDPKQQSRAGYIISRLSRFDFLELLIELLLVCCEETPHLGNLFGELVKPGFCRASQTHVIQYRGPVSIADVIRFVVVHLHDAKRLRHLICVTLFGTFPAPLLNIKIMGEPSRARTAIPRYSCHSSGWACRLRSVRH